MEIIVTDRVDIRAERLPVNGEDFITVASCYYRFAAPTKSRYAVHWHHYDLGRDDEAALIAGWDTSCVDDLTLSLVRSRSTESAGYRNRFLKVRHWRCANNLTVRIIFMDGAGGGRDWTRWPDERRSEYSLSLLKSWRSH